MLAAWVPGRDALTADQSVWGRRCPSRGKGFDSAAHLAMVASFFVYFLFTSLYTHTVYIAPFGISPFRQIINREE